MEMSCRPVNQRKFKNFSPRPVKKFWLGTCSPEYSPVRLTVEYNGNIMCCMHCPEFAYNNNAAVLPEIKGVELMLVSQ
uniref:Uncharacterized protein n=1 Tax=Romanomermis culicivorax TaxID=13658 RepID=A0A915J231_ROMCU